MVKPAAPPVSTEQVEHDFYQALQQGDLQRLMACWVDDDDAMCVPPGAEPLRGLAAIRGLFTELFAAGGVRVQVVQCRRSQGLDYAVHWVTEHVQVQSEQGTAVAVVFATNVYVKTPAGWRLLTHHASPGGMHMGQDASRLEANTNVLH
jgi:ketosteroid isomerase-like protein